MTRTLILVALLLSSAIGVAQDKDATEKPAKKPAKAAKPAAEQPPITDPAVIAVLESKPETPAEQFEAARLLADLGQPELARPLLKKILDAQLDDAALAALLERSDTPTLMRFGGSQTLAPEAEQLASAVLAAAERLARDPARLDMLVKQLGDAEAAKREDAIIALKRAGGAAVGPLLSALADDKRAGEHAAAREMILRLRDDATSPLSSAIDSPDVGVRALAIELLGELNAERELPSLVAALTNPAADPRVKQAAATAIRSVLGRVPSVTDSRQFLERKTQKELDRARLIDAQDNYGGDAPLREVWRWDAKQSRPVMSLERAANVARQTAARTARAMAAMDVADNARRRLFLTAMIEEAKSGDDLDRPLAPEIAKELAAQGPEAINELLAGALASGNVATAIGAAEVLGEIGTPALLGGIAGQPSPLAEAAAHADPRLRFAAIDAILKLKPMTSFAGASAVGEGLKFFASTSGFRKALVADPRSRVAGQLASYLTQLGYETDIATNGRDAFAVATSSPDYEVAFIHTAIERPRADDLLEQLRKDRRTAKLPVALIAVPEYPEPAARLASGAPFTHGFAEPQDAKGLKFQIDRLLSMPGCQPVPLDVRKQYAVWAVSALAELAEHPVPWLDTRAISLAVEPSLYSAGLTAPVASLLASAGTATGQSSLVQLAARESLPLATRELAAIAFARSVARHGILLTSDQILAQYDRYNSNAGLNPQTHKVMLMILDAIEHKSKGGDPKPETFLR